MVILATTTTNPRSEFCSDAARLNVALTRARRHLVVVGATHVLAQVRTYLGQPEVRVWLQAAHML